MQKKLTFYRPAAAAFLVMMAMALTSSTIGFFLQPICESLQISRGSFSVIFSLMSVSGALVNPFVGQYAGKKGVRSILLAAGLWSGGCMILLSMVTELWMLYAIALCMGVFGTTCMALCGNVIVQQSYYGPQASAILGAVMAGSGVGGMIFSLVIPSVIATWNWRVGLWVMGICWLALLWAAMLLLGKQNIQQATGNGAVGLGMTRAEALKSPKLYLMMSIIMVNCACNCIQQQLPSLLASYSFGESTVSIMVSVMTASLAVGKVAQGLLYGRIGIQKGGLIMMGVFAAGFLALLSPALVWPGLILVAFGLGTYTTLLPQVTRRIFGSREYAAIWALIATAGSVGTFIANPAWGTIFDKTGSYALALIGCAVLLVVTMWALVKALKNTK